MNSQQPGVLIFDGDIVCYEFTDTGLSARTLGETRLRPMTAALETAIRSDMDRQRAKLQALPEQVAERAWDDAVGF